MSAMMDAISLLQPAVQRLVIAYLDAFPGSSISSGRRSIDDQARIDAENTVKVRDFVARTYVPSCVRDAMVAVCGANPGADAAALAPLFASALGQFTDEELSHFSLHLSGHAVDLVPVADPEREAWARAWVAKFCEGGGGDPSRCRVLTREADLDVLHVQLVVNPPEVS